MADGNVEVILALYDLQRRNEEALVALYDLELEVLRSQRPLKGSPTFTGHDGVRAWFHSLVK